MFSSGRRHQQSRHQCCKWGPFALEQRSRGHSANALIACRGAGWSRYGGNGWPHVLSCITPQAPGTGAVKVAATAVAVQSIRCGTHDVCPKVEGEGPAPLRWMMAVWEALATKVSRLEAQKRAGTKNTPLPK